MTTLVSRVVLVAIVVALTSTVVTAQPGPDPSLWCPCPTNPDGSTVVPAILYDPGDGIMWLDAAGLNRTVDTTMPTLIGGDDVGMIAMSIESPEPTAFLLDGFVTNPNIGGGVVWTTMYFNGKTQIFGVGAGAEYLEPAIRTDLFQFPPGLTFADFGQIELAVNFESGAPGATMFGSMYIPEPSAFLIAIPALMGFVSIVRRRRK